QAAAVTVTDPQAILFPAVLFRVPLGFGKQRPALVQLQGGVGNDRALPPGVVRQGNVAGFDNPVLIVEFLRSPQDQQVITASRVPEPAGDTDGGAFLVTDTVVAGEAVLP